MMKKALNILFAIIVFIGGVILIYSGASLYPGMAKTQTHTLYRFCDSLPYERCGYRNENGDTIVPPGTYLLCLTDSFQTFGVVLDENTGFFGIDPGGKILFEIYPYDNGPDYLSEGKFRIVKEGKIGYANANGQVIIEPRFDCAFPFENGYAKVSLSCKKISEGEFTLWKSDQWFYIDENGKPVFP